MCTFELAHEAVKLTTMTLAGHPVSVKVSADLPVVLGDPTRLSEVLQNLLENAIKFMGEQCEPCIEIGAHCADGKVICHVRDNGIGINPCHHDKIFNLFESLDPDTGGTGVGLAIVKRIIEGHGGNVWVDSEGVGHGCTMYFALPQPIGPCSGAV